MRKTHTKTPQRRKTLYAGLGMTNTADRILVIGELLNMTTSTRQMAGKFH
jgi:hypothetical protein